MTVAELRDELAEMAGFAIVRVEGDGVAYDVSKDFIRIPGDDIPPTEVLVVTIKGVRS